MTRDGFRKIGIKGIERFGSGKIGKICIRV